MAGATPSQLSGEANPGTTEDDGLVVDLVDLERTIPMAKLEGSGPYLSRGMSLASPGQRTVGGRWHARSFPCGTVAGHESHTIGAVTRDGLYDT